MRNNKPLLFIGIFFIFMGILAIFNSVYENKAYQVLWLCYLSLILIGIAIIYKNSKLIVSQLNIVTIPLIVWSIDFFYILITGNSLWVIADYFFALDNVLSKIIALQHIITIPLSLYALYHIKIKEKRAWIISVIQITAIFILTRLFVSKELNTNWAYFPGQLPYPQFLPYPITWLAAMFLMILVTNIVLNKSPYFRRSRSL